MPLLRAYLALSLDGYIADAQGGVGWLAPYFSPELGFHEFQESIGATVLGRATFDQALELGRRFDEERTVVLTHRALEGDTGNAEAFDGDVRELAATLKSELEPSGKDVWLMGGGQSLAAFHAADLVDRWELYIIPTLLGAGLPLFPPDGPATETLRPLRTQAFANGVVELCYEPMNRGGA